MKRNLVISLLIHIIISVAAILFYHPSSANCYISSFDYNTENIIFFIIMLFYLIISFFLAGNILKFFDSWQQQILSVSSVAILMLIVWIICYLLDDGRMLSHLIWIFFYYCSLPFIPVYSIMERFWNIPTNDTLPYWTILFAIIPSLLMWLGIEIKRYVNIRASK